MLIALIGGNCSGKSTMAERLQTQRQATVFVGKDYLRMAKNEKEVAELFRQRLATPTDEWLVYVISEQEQVGFLPKEAKKILVIADLATIKERFAQRMHGHLPEPVSRMLERHHGKFADENVLGVLDTTTTSIEENYERLLALVE